MNKCTASIITIGDELLIGQTIDTNSAWLGQQLNSIGVWVNKRIAVGDIAADIMHTLDTAMQQSEMVIITGGLGPTADDITKPTLLKYFGGEMVQQKDVEQHVRAFFEKRKRPILDVNIKQAQIPSSASVLWNRYGTAPGMLFNKDNKLVFSLPGVPLEMKDIMQQHGFAAIKAHYTLPSVMHKTLCTAGKGESFIAEMLKDFEQQLPAHIKLAYLPSLGQVKLRLTSINGTEEELNNIAQQLHTIVKHICYAEQDISLQEKILTLLTQQQKKLILAESCTGGYLAHLFTNVSGSSTVLYGSMVTYQQDAKQAVLSISADKIQQYGIVSEQVATEMAVQALNNAKADFALATTGYLESDTQNEAQIWIAVASKQKVNSYHSTLPYYRERNKELAANYALLLLYRSIIDA